MYSIISSCFAAIAGFLIISYSGFVDKHGYPLSEFYQKYASGLSFLGWILIASAGFQLFSQLKFFSILVFIGCFVASTGSIWIFKKHIQWISFLLIIVSILIWVIGGVEIVSIKQ